MELNKHAPRLNYESDHEHEDIDNDDELSSYKNIKANLFRLAEAVKNQTTNPTVATTSSNAQNKHNTHHNHHHQRESSSKSDPKAGRTSKLFYTVDTEVEHGHDNPGEQKLVKHQRRRDDKANSRRSSLNSYYKLAKAKYNEVNP